MITDLRYAIRQITIAQHSVAAPATSALARAIDALRRIEEELVELSAGVGTYGGMTPAEVVADRDRYNIACEMPNKALHELYLEVMSDYDSPLAD